VMKTLTVGATILLVPTLISSIYGMNFEYMPFLHDQNGFSIIMMSSIVVVIALLWYFKKKNWY